MEHLLLDAWAAEVAGVFSGKTLATWDLLREGLVRLGFGRGLPHILLHLKPRRIFYCFSKELAATRKSFSLNLPEELLRPGRLLSVARLPHDRILKLSFASPQGDCSFMLELIPSSPNLMLLDGKDAVLWMLNRDRISARGLGAGCQYRPPNRPLRLSISEALKTQQEPGVPLEAWLLRHVEGTSPLTALEWAHRAGRSAANLPTAAAALYRETLSPHVYSTTRSESAHWATLDPWGHLALSPWSLHSQPMEAGRCFDTANAALEFFSAKAIEWTEFQELKRTVLSALSTRLQRLKRSQQAASRDLTRLEDPERYRVFGELLLVHLGKLQRHGKPARGAAGVATVRIADHYATPGSKVNIPIDPRKSIQSNAEDFFKLYRKAQRGALQAAARLQELQQLLDRCEEQHRAAISACDLPCLAEISAYIELDSRAPAKRTRRAPAGQGRRREYTSSEGYQILVGQSSLGNEELTFQLADPTDIWLHVADYAGSHVIIRNPTRRALPMNTLIEAASLAAFYSNARRQSNVEVRYTERKFVHRIKGAAPGMVRLQRFKSLFVHPSRVIGASSPSSHGDIKKVRT